MDIPGLNAYEVHGGMFILEEKGHIFWARFRTNFHLYVIHIFKGNNG